MFFDFVWVGTYIKRCGGHQCVDAAFAQRRKTLRAALAGWAGGADRAEAALVAAGIDPRTRGERLGIDEFAAIASAHAPATQD